MHNDRKSSPNRLRSWLITLGGFLFLLLIFFIIDGTFLEPNLNDSNNLAGQAAGWLAESKLFNESISLFTFPFFNLATAVLVIVLCIKALRDILSIMKNNG